MAQLSKERQVELLQSLFMMDVWNEFLLPSYKEAAEILVNQTKVAKDPHEMFKLVGQLIGLDAIINLPILCEVLQAQVKAEKEGSSEVE